MTKTKTHISNFPNLPFTLLLLLLLLNSLTISSDDGSVMSDLKKSLNPKSLWTEPNFCDWKYISCDTQGRVTVIQLKDLGLVGTLPPNLNNLTALTDFELQGNNIQGPLPTFSGLSQLRLLLLTGNNFSSIPSDFFTGLTSLTSVNMDKIPFAPWTISESLKDATSLQNLSMNSANIMGRIPDFINGDTFLNLLELHLSFNMLEGGLPHGFSTLTVQSLWLNGQKRDTTKFTLVGTIEVLQNMTSLKEVWLHSNGLFGPLPDFSGLKDLSTLSIRDNQFTGPVPQSLVNLPSLKVVNLTNNLLQGPVPKFVSNSVQVDMAGGNSFCNTPATASKGCDPRVNTLLTVAGSFGYPTVFGEQWKGNDPCAQDWPGISCDDNGNVTVIIFANKKLNGTISPAFAEFKALKTLNLANNNISGSIPKELVEISTIKLIDLSNNQLMGDIPKYDNTTMTLNTTGNPAIGTHPPPPATTPGGSIVPPGSPPGEITGNTGSHKKASVGVIVGCVIGGAVLLAVLIWLGLHMSKKKKRFARVQSPNAMVVHPRHSGSDPDMVKITVAGSNMNVGATSETYSQTSSGPGDVQLVEAGNMVISIQVLRNVTNNFSEENVLGRGGFGTVYKGELHDGTKIAVKRMESGIMSGKGLTEFKSEIAVLTKVRHRHLVALLGYCLDGNERLLVYEYMPQGTLSHHLFNWRDQNLKPLEWTRRLTIALDVARGVEYLHGLAHQSFIHRDLKPSNILLGDDMRAKVADFGLVRLAPDGKASIETRLAGTFGYLAPEYAVTGRVTTKVDVYSFGVILMELITGRKALDERENEESMHLVSWFRRMHINKDTFHKAIDPVIELTEETLASISTVAELAGHCSAREPYQRPDMGHAVNVLSSLVELWKPTETDTEDMYGIDLDMTLPQALKKWQAFEGSSRMDGDTSSFLASVDNTQTSIPTRPSGFADSFTSADGR